MKKQLTSSAWRLRTGNVDEYLYHLQFDNVSIKAEVGIFLEMKEWNLVAEMWQSTNNLKNFVFAKHFKNENEWQIWAKKFSHILVEYSSNTENIKTTKLGKQEGRKRGRPRKFGITKRRKEKESKKRKNYKNSVKCSKCNKYGHNARTCVIVDNNKK